MKKYLVIIGIILLLGLGVFLGARYYLNKDLNNTKWIVVGWSVSSLDPTKVEISLNFEDNKIGYLVFSSRQLKYCELYF